MTDATSPIAGRAHQTLAAPNVMAWCSSPSPSLFRRYERSTRSARGRTSSRRDLREGVHPKARHRSTLQCRLSAVRCNRRASRRRLYVSLEPRHRSRVENGALLAEIEAPRSTITFCRDGPRQQTPGPSRSREHCRGFEELRNSAWSEAAAGRASARRCRGHASLAPRANVAPFAPAMLQRSCRPSLESSRSARVRRDLMTPAAGPSFRAHHADPLRVFVRVRSPIRTS